MYVYIIYIYILHGSVYDPGFQALRILSDECVKHETQGHRHYHVLSLILSTQYLKIWSIIHLPSELVITINHYHIYIYIYIHIYIYIYY